MFDIRCDAFGMCIRPEVSYETTARKIREAEAARDRDRLVFEFHGFSWDDEMLGWVHPWDATYTLASVRDRNALSWIEGELPPLEPEAPQQADPRQSVSELEQRLLDLQGQLLTEQSYKIEHLLRIQQVDRRITNLEERLRSLVLVVDELVKNSGTIAEWQMEHDAVSADSVYEKE